MFVISTIKNSKTMYLIPQETANQIAATQPIQHPKMQKLFQGSEEEADQMESRWRKEIARESGQQIARAMVAFSPLLLEQAAITNHINLSEDYSLRQIMPELLTAEETALLAQQEYNLTAAEVKKLTLLLRKEQAALPSGKN